MGSDISRKTFDKTKHYNAVVMQQGRVQLDADWNEQQDITAHHDQTLTVDAVGPNGAPNYAPGFAISVDSSGKNFTIGKGRYYLEGFLCENESDVAYAAQPDLLDPPALADLLERAKTNTAIVYLDVWQRDISMWEDPHIREQALGGPDTATRVKTIWQVKFLPVKIVQSNQTLLLASLQRLIIGLNDYHSSNPSLPPADAKQVQGWADSLQESATIGSSGLQGEHARRLYRQLPQLRRDLNRISKQTNISATGLLRELGRLDTELGKAVQEVNCHSAFDEWFQLTAPSTDTLMPQVEQASADSSPCAITPQGGFEASENQLYRVEVHRAGELTDPRGASGPTFKWSRDNGSVVVGMARINGAQVTVTSLGRDDLLGLAHDQWVEVLDDRLELAGLPGQLVQIDTIDPATLTVTMKQSVGKLSANAEGVDPGRHPKLRRWDQQGDQQGLDIDLSPVTLESGISVVFSAGSYKTGDYWLIPARSNGTIEWPPFESASAPRAALAPLGITHHYSRLGIVNVDEAGQVHVHDCRRIFAPLAAPAMRVVATNWENDTEFPLSRLLDEGLLIWLDAEPFSQSLNPGSVIVTVEMPLPAKQQPDASHTRNYSAIPVILKGAISVTGNNLQWLPRIEDLRHTFAQAGFHHASISGLRLRVTLKGHVIQSDQLLPVIYLDGQAFGQARPPQSGTQAPTTALIFPSGSGAPASDFESWLYLLDDSYDYEYGYGSHSIGGHLL